ncbi:MAG: hypothetical protein Q7S48_04715 [bacterium]|nr:hypothetical protein [bacterium]
MEHLVQEKKDSADLATNTVQSKMIRAALSFIFCALFFLMPYRLYAAALLLSPTNQTMTVGQEITVLLRVNTQGSAINAIESTITYPSNLFTGVSISKTGSILTLWAQEPAFNSVAGTVRFAGGRPSPGFNGVGDVLRITFRSSSAGNVAVNIGTSSILLNDGNGTESFNAGASQNALYTLSNPPAEPVVPDPEPEPEPTPEIVPGPEPSPEPIPESEPTSSTTPTPTPTPASTTDSSTPTPTPGSPTDTTPTPTNGSVAQETPPSETAPVVSPVNLGEVPVIFEVPKFFAPTVDSIFSVIPQGVRTEVREAREAIQESKVYKAIDSAVINNPVVEEIAVKVAAPAIVATAVANLGFAARLATLFTYLQGLATQPILIFARRKKKQWGLLYSSLTKLPVDLAVVRLVDPVSGKLLQTRVSDKQGRYLFLADPGTYRLEVTKPGFAFPSEFLKDKTSDLDFADLYHGEIINVSERGIAIVRPIPLDPIEKMITPKDVISRRRKVRLQKTIAWISPTIAVLAFVIVPTLLGAGLIVLQFVLLGLFRRISHGRKSEPWGKVIDEKTKQPLPLAIVRIFDVAFNKLLETQITDRKGRYALLVGRGTFYITVEKRGYASYKSETIDRAGTRAGEIVKKDVHLKPMASGDSELISQGATSLPVPPSPEIVPEPAVTTSPELTIAPETTLTPPPAPMPSSPEVVPPDSTIGMPSVKNPYEADRTEGDHPL